MITGLYKCCALFALTTLVPFTSGCVVVIGGCDWERSPAVWVEETVQIPIDPAGLTAMEVRTHNGEIGFTGSPSATAGSVTVRKKAGGSSSEDAHEAMAAIEVISERSANGRHRLDWRWKGDRKSRWAGEVAFQIHAPGSITLDTETHNGEVNVTDVAGDVKIVTHNGEVTVASRGGKLDAQTHNGAIKATYAGSNISLETHNGQVRVDLRQAGPVQGEVATHNGAIEVAVGASTSTELVAQTDNGRVSCDAPITVGKATNSRLEGKLGSGGEQLKLSTHNGSVTIKNAG